ncbi:MAG: type II toxin-antitoxin system MqsA family antitoxin [Candidatus Bipolaricaulota bacterium]|nr:type II toxin-antitoxin system MqsA family antitoxin [Candidatus Bipolaricaulota bacterium]
MKCLICKQGETRPERTTVALQRGGTTLVIRNVLAEVCENCSEAYVDEVTSREILHRAEEAAQLGLWWMFESTRALQRTSAASSIAEAVQMVNVVAC